MRREVRREVLQEVDDRIKDIKVYVDVRSAKVQKKLFELGARWIKGGRKPSAEIQEEDAPYLYVYEDGHITYGHFMITFKEHMFDEVNIDELLSWKPKLKCMKPEVNFKPFDKVLVREYTDEIWEMDFFSHYEEDSRSPYRCLTGEWRYCIPYEGNEHLIRTTDME